MTVADRALVGVLPAVPRPLVRRLSQRYIAGPELADACRVTRRLNGEGKMATLDVLGEEITEREEALALVDEYRDAIEAIDREGLDANVSVKLTGLGLKLDEELCLENLVTLVRCAAAHGNFVRIDMEDSSTIDTTLALYRRLRAQGHDNVGVVLQAYLPRTLADARSLADLRPSVRVCKGIYAEPDALGDPQRIRRSFVQIVEELLAARAYVAIATHDELVLDACLRAVERRGLRWEEYELQMLLGVREQLARELVRKGHRLRVYVPFGRQWYEYSLRRLQENPKLATTIARETVGRILRG